MRIVARWYDDGEYWFFEKMNPPDSRDHEPASGAFVIEVADEIAQQYFDAHATMDRLSMEIPNTAGLASDRGTLKSPCGEFASDRDPNPDLRRDWRQCDTCGHYADEHQAPA